MKPASTVTRALEALARPRQTPISHIHRAASHYRRPFNPKRPWPAPSSRRAYFSARTRVLSTSCCRGRRSSRDERQRNRPRQRLGTPSCASRIVTRRHQERLHVFDVCQGRSALQARCRAAHHAARSGTRHATSAESARSCAPAPAKCACGPRCTQARSAA